MKAKASREQGNFSEFQTYLASASEFCFYLETTIKILESKECFVGGKKAAASLSFEILPPDYKGLKDGIIQKTDEICETLINLGLFGMLNLLVLSYAKFVERF